VALVQGTNRRERLLAVLIEFSSATIAVLLGVDDEPNLPPAGAPGVSMLRTFNTCNRLWKSDAVIGLLSNLWGGLLGDWMVTGWLVKGGWLGGRFAWLCALALLVRTSGPLGGV
jgi:hypothetical protein